MYVHACVCICVSVCVCVCACMCEGTRVCIYVHTCIQYKRLYIICVVKEDTLVTGDIKVQLNRSEEEMRKLKRECAIYQSQLEVHMCLCAYVVIHIYCTCTYVVINIGMVQC